MVKKDQAFVCALSMVAQDQPDCFSIKEGDFYFLNWRMPAWMVLALSEDLTFIAKLHDEKMEAAA